MLPLLIALATPPGTAPPLCAALSIRLSAPAEILVGEPTKLKARWSTNREIDVQTANAEIWLDSGRGFERYRESSFGSASTVYLDERLKPGSPIRTQHILAVSGYAAGPNDRRFKLAFPRPGQVMARLRYADCNSNTATISVVPPKGRDAEILSEHLAPRPELLSEWGLLPELGRGEIERLAEDFKGSRYLAWPQLLLWRRQLDEAIAELPARGQPGEREPLANGPLRLLEFVSTLAFEDSPFDEDRLALLAETRRRLGLLKEAQDADRELLTKYPESAVASKTARRLADEAVADAHAAEVIKQLQKSLQEQGLELPMPSPPPPEPKE